MRPVDADAIYNEALENLRKGEIEDWEFDSIINYLDGAPTLNVETNMRCKGCKHYRNHPNGLCYLHTEPKENERGYSGVAVCVEPDDFCSYGVKKGGTVF